MKIYLKTYGCQMNERDSDAMAADLVASGYQMVANESEADVLLFNTCSVREAAERKAKGKIGYLKKLKDRNPDLIIGAMGCMAQRLGRQLLDELPHLDFVLGTGQLHQLVPTLNELAQERGKRLVKTTQSPEIIQALQGHYQNSWSGQIAITRGCNRFCSYCIVPYVRGREISRPMESIISEARQMTERGVKEILLLGQNVAAYGLNGDIRPPEPDHSPFAELLEELEKLPQLLRIRFTSPYISYFNTRLIKTLAASHKICHQLHLPLQSGSDRILQAMNRQYSNASYREKVAELKANISNLTLSTDVIVGFPGETEADFKLTRELMNDIGFEQAYIFKYSPRPGAKSALMADSVPEAVKEERNQILLEDLKTRVEKRLGQLVGETVQVLAEGVSARNASRWTGRTDNNFVVHFEPVPGLTPGQLLDIKITRANVVSLLGEIVR